MNAKHSANCVKAKARKRMASPPPDYPALLDHSKPVRRLTVEDLTTGESHTFTLFISASRIDQFRCDVDGKPWKEQIGWSRLMASIRKSQPRFSQMT